MMPNIAGSISFNGGSNPGKHLRGPMDNPHNVGMLPTDQLCLRPVLALGFDPDIVVDGLFVKENFTYIPWFRPKDGYKNLFGNF